MVDTVIVENEQQPASAVSWPAIVAGSAIMAALSLLLLALGAGIGFSIIDPWSDSMMPATTKAATVAGIYLTVTAVLASAVGGYVTGRLRNLWPGVHHHEAFFRDTAHGFIAWAVAVVAGAALLGSAASGITHLRDGGANGRAIVGQMALLDRSLSEQQRQVLADIAAQPSGAPALDAQRVEVARRVATMMSFWLVASMFAGALAASLAAWEGGGIRDGRYRYGN